MKKIIALVLASIMLFTLCSCGKSDAVKNVENMIDALGSITYESIADIVAAESAYDNLAENEQKKVDNYNSLLAAREAYDALPNEIEVQVEKEVYVVVLEDSLLGTYEYSDYVINENGQVTEYYRGGGDGSTYYLEYNDDGTVSSKNRISRSGYERGDYIYDEDGYLVREYWSSDWSIQNGKEFTYKYTFDNEGRIATKVSENVNVIYNVNSVVEYSYTYNENNQVIREYQHTDDSTFIIEYIYDDHGNVIEERISELNNSDDGWTNYYTYEYMGTYTTTEIRRVK